MPPPVGFPPLGSGEGFTPLHAGLPWSLALLLGGRRLFGADEDTEEAILDFSRAWGSPEDVQLPAGYGSILGSLKKTELLPGILL